MARPDTIELPRWVAALGVGIFAFVATALVIGLVAPLPEAPRQLSSEAPRQLSSVGLPLRQADATAQSDEANVVPGHPVGPPAPAPSVTAPAIPTAPPTASGPIPPDLTTPPDLEPLPAVSPNVESALQSLIDGHVAYKWPDRMKVGESALVQAVLSAHKDAAELQAEFISKLGPGETTRGDSIKLFPKMAATLSGAGLAVSPSGPQIQAISRAEDNVWSWTVEATEPGKYILVLGFDVVLTVGAFDTLHTLVPFEREIEVFVGWPSDFHGWVSLVRQTADDMKWAVAVLVGVAGSAATWRRRKPTTA